MRKRGEESGEADAGGEAIGAARADRAKPVARGVSGVANVFWAQESGVQRPKPFQARARGGAYLARVATAAEGEAVVDAWRQVGSVLGLSTSPKAVRETVQRFARDKIQGQGSLPLGDGLEGLPLFPDDREGKR